MPTHADPLVSENDWAKVPLRNKWWFQAVLTFLIIPVGLAFVLFVPAYQKRKGKVERVGKGAKSILAVLGTVLVIFGLAKLGSGSSSLEVTLFGMGMRIMNVGTEPIEVRGSLINGRAECSPPRTPKTLKVGEEVGWRSECLPIIRATITTNKGDLTYSFR